MAQRICGVDLKEWIIAEDCFSINKGEIAEQFVGQELIAESPPRDKANVYYWHREAKSSNAEVDYLITKEAKIIPIEVKEGTKGSMKSLHLFLNEKSCNCGIRFSQNNFARKGSIQNIPIYAVHRIAG